MSGPIVEETIVFPLNGNVVQWSGTTQAVSLDIRDGVPFVVATPPIPSPRCYNSESQFRYYKFDKSWERIHAKNLPDGIGINLLFSAWEPQAKSHYTLNEKKRLDALDRASNDYFKKPLKVPC